MNQMFIHILLCALLFYWQSQREVSVVHKCMYKNDIRKPFSLPCVKGFFNDYN